MPAAPTVALIDPFRPKVPPFDACLQREAPLLALVLGCTEEAAATMLARVGSLARLARFEVEELIDIAQCSRAEAERIAAACELGRRGLVHETRPVGPLLGVAALARWFRLRIGGLLIQETWMVALNDAGGVRGAVRVSRADIHGCGIDAAAVMRLAKRSRVERIILVHNHPSGDVAATREDLGFVLRVHRAGLSANVKLVDCIITGPTDRYTSLAEQGVLPGGS